MDECKRVEEYFVDYIEGILSSEGKKKIDEHLKNCYHCSSTLKGVLLLRENLKRLKKVKTSENFELALRGKIQREMDRRAPLVKLREVVSLRRLPVYSLVAVFLFFIGYLAWEKFSPHPQEFPTYPEVISSNIELDERVYYVLDEIPLTLLSQNRARKKQILPPPDSIEISLPIEGQKGFVKAVTF